MKSLFAPHTLLLLTASACCGILLLAGCGKMSPSEPDQKQQKIPVQIDPQIQGVRTKVSMEDMAWNDWTAPHEMKWSDRDSVLIAYSASTDPDERFVYDYRQAGGAWSPSDPDKGLYWNKEWDITVTGTGHMFFGVYPAPRGAGDLSDREDGIRIDSLDVGGQLAYFTAKIPATQYLADDGGTNFRRYSMMAAGSYRDYPQEYETVPLAYQTACSIFRFCFRNDSGTKQIRLDSLTVTADLCLAGTYSGLISPGYDYAGGDYGWIDTYAFQDPDTGDISQPGGSKSVTLCLTQTEDGTPVSRPFTDPTLPDDDDRSTFVTLFVLPQGYSEIKVNFTLTLKEGETEQTKDFEYTFTEDVWGNSWFPDLCLNQFLLKLT